jgi:hypothetical protein
MTRAEVAYQEILERRKLAGEIHVHRYECMSLRLGHRCFYHPDFYVVALDYTIEIHEVKGYMEDDARVKLMAAASAFPEFRFILARAKKVRGGWDFAVSEVPAREWS